MSVSVIVPNFNHARFLVARIESILNQTFRDFELILLDDASTDGSAEILGMYSSHPSVAHTVINSVNTGNPFVQWSKGIALAKYDLIWIAESDDLADPDFLSRLIAEFLLDEKIGLAFSRSIKVDDRGKVLEDRHLELVDKLVRSPITNSNIFDLFFELNIIPNASSAIFKKSILTRSKWDPQKFRYVGDWFAWIEIASYSRLAYVSDTLNYFRTHHQTTRTKVNTLNYITEEYELRGILHKKTSTIDKVVSNKVYDRLASRLISAIGVKSLLCKYDLILYLLDVDRRLLIRLVYRFFLKGWNGLINLRDKSF